MTDTPLSGRRDPTPVEGGRRFGSTGSAVLLAVFAVGVLASGCATKGDVRDVRNEIRELSVRQDSLLRTLVQLQRATRDSLSAQSDVLFSIRGELGRQILEIQEQLVEVQELTGQSQRSLAGIRDQIEARRSEFGRQEEQRQQRDPPAGRDPAAGAEPDTAEGLPGTVEARGEPEDLYNIAVRHFNRGSLTTARRAFQRFLDVHSNHRLAPDAQFYLADILAQENRLEDAVEAFLEIPELYPTADRVPTALYRAARLHLELGNTEEARELLERVVESYPDSDAAVLAEEELEAIS